MLPILVAVAVAIRVKLGPGVVYRQQRIGRHGRTFTMYKFRTMAPDRRRAWRPFDGFDRRQCHKRDDDPRHTAFGRFLRRTSLDELPQFWNVVKGDMSLVGPRPELVEVVARYQRWQHCRHHVKPGITGSGRSPSAQAAGVQGVHLDLEYFSAGPSHDCSVLLRTIR